LVTSLGPFDLAYLDPPYNQHRYDSNYHVWETLAVGDEPEHFGKACKRADLRDPALRSPFSVRRLMPGALARCIERVDAATVMVSLSDESWVSIDDLRDMCAVRGAVEMLGFTSRRYVGAQIGIHSPSGQRVGTVGRLHNTEHVAICGEIRPALRRRLDALSAEGVTPPAR
jgi:adenine-specific DNA-methyltransferase